MNPHECNVHESIKLKNDNHWFRLSTGEED